MNNLIYVELLNEGSVAYRPVEAMELRENVFKIIEQPYDTEDEEWEFVPGDIVNVIPRIFGDGATGLLAVSKLSE